MSDQPKNTNCHGKVVSTTRYPAGKFFQVPNGIHKVVSSPYDLAALLFLMQCADGNGTSFPSYATIAQGIMSRCQAMISVSRLNKSGIISIQERPNASNVFTVNFDRLVNLIDQSTVSTSRPRRALQSTKTTIPVNQVDPNHTQGTKPTEQEEKNNLSLIDEIYSEAQI